MRGEAATGLREAIARQRDVVRSLTVKTHALMAHLGVAAKAHVDEIAGALQAALVDPAVGEQLEEGRLLEIPAPAAGFGQERIPPGSALRAPTDEPSPRPAAKAAEASRAAKAAAASAKEAATIAEIARSEEEAEALEREAEEAAARATDAAQSADELERRAREAAIEAARLAKDAKRTRAAAANARRRAKRLRGATSRRHEGSKRGAR